MDSNNDSRHAAKLPQNVPAVSRLEPIASTQVPGLPYVTRGSIRQMMSRSILGAW